MSAPPSSPQAATSTAAPRMSVVSTWPPVVFGMVQVALLWGLGLLVAVALELGRGATALAVAGVGAVSLYFAFVVLTTRDNWGAARAALLSSEGAGAERPPRADLVPSMVVGCCLVLGLVALTTALAVYFGW